MNIDHSFIHHTAIIEEGATIEKGCKIGPYCIIGKNVLLKENVELISHVTISGYTTMGSSTVCYPFSSIGHIPQDLKYQGEESRLEIGSHNIIREHVTIQPGTQKGGMLTKVGNNNLFMVSSHIAHDCIVGDFVVMANNATLAGHVIVEDRVIIGGLSAVRQFVRLGENAMIEGMTGVANDVIPFGLVYGTRASLRGLNVVGMKRRRLPREEIQEIKEIYDFLFKTEGLIEEKINVLEKKSFSSEGAEKIISFLHKKSSPGYCLPEKKVGFEADDMRE